MHIRRFVVLGVAAAVLASGPSQVFAQGAPKLKEEQKRSKAQQEEVNQVFDLLDKVMMAEPVTPTSAKTDEQQGEVKVTWDSGHFLKGQGGQTYVPFTVVIDRSALASPNAMVYVRAVSKTPAPAAAPAKKDDKKPVTYAWSDANFAQVDPSGKFSRAMMLAGGEYDLFIVARDSGVKGMPKTGILRRSITVPDFTKAELATSSVILGGIDQLAAPLANDKQRENPYTFGLMKVMPTETGKFGKTAELAVVFWVYGAGTDAATKKPNVTIEYNFHQKNADGTEKFFNKTAPQDLNAMTLPPDMDAAFALPGVQTVPMMVFPAGDYRLEIKISDKATNKTLTQNVNFTVSAS